MDTLRSSSTHAQVLVALCLLGMATADGHKGYKYQGQGSSVVVSMGEGGDSSEESHGGEAQPNVVPYGKAHGGDESSEESDEEQAVVYYGKARGGNEYGSSEYGKAYHTEPNYNFKWGVADAKSGNYYSHAEQRKGKDTQGEYRVKLPDGRTQIVTYKADAYGYRPVVRYEGQVKYGGKGKYAGDSSEEKGEQVLYVPRY
ncbi:unnamed protein product [Darwinula stevensoni]|uniref:Uncharacterized protein n=1 Tax=Darwinula stevensoni TaxID=69355 RepID=A0A7R9A8H3_9CRUS|nr:unnamed protein product [Darwinula stevensoni]CAG0896469.1 unnamed protein product [Darwinula stevensoni]